MGKTEDSVRPRVEVDGGRTLRKALRRYRTRKLEWPVLGIVMVEVDMGVCKTCGTRSSRLTIDDLRALCRPSQARDTGLKSRIVKVQTTLVAGPRNQP